MDGSIRRLGLHNAYFVGNGCSPGCSTTSSACSCGSGDGPPASDPRGPRSSLVRPKFPIPDTPVPGAAINWRRREAISEASSVLGAPPGGGALGATRPDTGVNPASDMFEVTYGGTAAA